MPKRPIVPEDLLRIQIPSDPQLSPDGKSVVFAVKKVGSRNNYLSHLWLWKDGSLTQLTFGEVSDTQPRWKPDGSGVSFVSNRRKPKPQIFFLPLSGGEPREMTDLPEGSLGRYEWSPDGQHIAFLFRERSSTRTKEAKEEREKSGLSEPPVVTETLFWRWDGDGVFEDDRYKLHLLSLPSLRPRVLLQEAKDGAYVFCWAPDSKCLAVSFNTSDRPTLEPWEERLFRVDIGSGEREPIAGHPDGEFSALSWSPDGRWIACAFADRSEKRFGYKKTDLCLIGAGPEAPEFRNLTADADHDLGASTLSDLRESGGEVRLFWDGGSVVTSIVGKGLSHVYRVTPDGDAGALTRGAMELALSSYVGGTAATTRGSADSMPELLVLKDGGEVWASGFNSELAEEVEMSVPELHWVESADGAKVQTWVIRPRRARGETLPCAIEVHGGPHAMYSGSFFFEMQLLAANGYVVVFSNPRGSTGYGEDFARCIDGDWGNKDWADVQAVTEFAKSLPYVDPNRVAIMGGSYGGYMVNWAIGHSDAYKCAITDRCVSNLLSKSGNSDYTFIPNGNWPGSAWENWEKLWECSPVKHFGNVSTPTLVIHSEGDLRCHVEQGEQAYTFLKMRGVPTRLVRYPANTSHGMSRGGPPDMRVHRLNEMLGWLREWL